MVITSYPRFWRQDPATLPRPTPQAGIPNLRKAALFDLAEIQRCIDVGDIDRTRVQIVTKNCELDLQKLRWTSDHLLRFMCQLRPYSLKPGHDFKHAMWCEGSDRIWYPCDGYRTNFDHEQMRRDRNGVSIYVKFSIPEDGECLLFAVSAHD